MVSERQTGVKTRVGLRRRGQANGGSRTRPRGRQLMPPGKHMPKRGKLEAFHWALTARQCRQSVSPRDAPEAQGGTARVRDGAEVEVAPLAELPVVWNGLSCVVLAGQSRPAEAVVCGQAGRDASCEGQSQAHGKCPGWCKSFRLSLTLYAFLLALYAC